MLKDPHPSQLNVVTSWCAFLFFALMFAVPSGYSYGAGLLLLASLAGLMKVPAGVALAREDRLIVYVLLFYFIVSAVMVAVHGHPLNDLDQSSRALLAVPILLLLYRHPPAPGKVWAGLALGVVLSVPVALWQLYVLHYDRAEGFLNIIHFGNIALVFGLCCLAGLFWVRLRGRHVGWWRAALLLGAVAAVYSIMASGSRASWVALPPALLLYGIAFVRRRNLGPALAGCLALVVALGVLFAMPGSPLKARYDAAVTDISQYTHQNEADTSLGARFEMWQGAALAIAERPWLGWSQHDYTERLQQRVQQGRLDPIALEFDNNLHNGYMQAWVFQGLPGMLALLTLYLYPLYRFCLRLRHSDLAVRVYAYCGAALCSCYVFFTLTQVILRRNNGILFYLLALAIFWACMRAAEQRRAPA